MAFGKKRNIDLVASEQLPEWSISTVYDEMSSAPETEEKEEQQPQKPQFRDISGGDLELNSDSGDSALFGEKNDSGLDAEFILDGAITAPSKDVPRGGEEQLGSGLENNGLSGGFVDMTNDMEAITTIDATSRNVGNENDDLTISTGESIPQAATQPVPEPVAQVAPQPVPEPVAQVAPQPVPEPVVQAATVSVEQSEPVAPIEPTVVPVVDAMVQDVAVQSAVSAPILQEESSIHSGESSVDSVEEKITNLANSVNEFDDSERVLSEAAAMLSSEESQKNDNEDSELQELLERLNVSDKVTQMNAMVEHDMAALQQEQESAPQQPTNYMDSDVLISNDMFDMGVDEEEDFGSSENIDLSLFDKKETMEPAVEPEPVVEPEVMVEPEPVVEPEVMVEPEPVVEPEVMVEPEPVVEPEVMVEPEPVVEPEVMVEPEPVVEPEVMVEPEPVVEPEVMVEPEPVVEPEVMAEPEPVVEPEPEVMVEPEPVVEPEPEVMVEPEPVVEPEVMVEPEPENSGVGMSDLVAAAMRNMETLSGDNNIDSSKFPDEPKNDLDVDESGAMAERNDLDFPTEMEDLSDVTLDFTSGLELETKDSALDTPEEIETLPHSTVDFVSGLESETIHSNLDPEMEAIEVPNPSIHYLDGIETESKTATIDEDTDVFNTNVPEFDTPNESSDADDKSVDSVQEEAVQLSEPESISISESIPVEEPVVEPELSFEATPVEEPVVEPELSFEATPVEEPVAEPELSFVSSQVEEPMTEQSVNDLIQSAVETLAERNLPEDIQQLPDTEPEDLGLQFMTDEPEEVKPDTSLQDMGLEFVPEETDEIEETVEEEPIFKLQFEPVYAEGDMPNLGLYQGSGDSLIIEDYVEAPTVKEVEENLKKQEKEKKRSRKDKKNKKDGFGLTLDDLEENAAGSVPTPPPVSDFKIQNAQPLPKKIPSPEPDLITVDTLSDTTDQRPTSAIQNILKDGKAKRTYFKLIYK